MEYLWVFEYFSWVKKHFSWSLFSMHHFPYMTIETGCMVLTDSGILSCQPISCSNRLNNWKIFLGLLSFICLKLLLLRDVCCLSGKSQMFEIKHEFQASWTENPFYLHIPCLSFFVILWYSPYDIKQLKCLSISHIFRIIKVTTSWLL